MIVTALTTRASCCLIYSLKYLNPKCVIVYHPCSNCRNHVSIKTNVNAPQELLPERGETFNLNCDKCKTTFQAESMRTRARTNPIKLVLGVLGSVVLAAFIWEMGFIATIAAAPAYGMYHLENGNVNAYNSLSLRRWG